jgi:hypothetical protein
VLGEPLAGPLSLGQLPGILRDACAILAACHRRGVIHDGIWIDALVRAPDRGFPLCLVNWRRARIGDPEEGRDDVYALGMAIYAALPDSAPFGLKNLIGAMLDERPTAEEVGSEASRLGEAAGSVEDPDVEEVILLTDLSREPVPLSIPTKPKWTPAPAMSMKPLTTPIALLKRRP